MIRSPAMVHWSGVNRIKMGFISNLADQHVLGNLVLGQAINQIHTEQMKYYSKAVSQNKTKQVLKTFTETNRLCIVQRQRVRVFETYVLVVALSLSWQDLYGSLMTVTFC